MAGVAGRSGLPKGYKHAGHFKEGFDPRRGLGTQKGLTREWWNKARQYGQEATDYLLSLVQDDEAETKERRLAAQFLVEQGFGKAVDRVQITALHAQGEASGVNLSLADLHGQFAPLIEGEAEEVYEQPADEADFIEIESDDFPAET